jgi:hypothetical protein
MSVDIFKYRNWVLETEKTQTETLYKNVSLSGAESCRCGTCKDFIALREKIYPDEIRDLFKKLGIDINKEVEVCDYGDDETGYIFSWWFHFIGEIIEGNDCDIPLQLGGYTMDLFQINDGFSIGFTRNISLTFFEDKQNLIQIELWAQVPRNLVTKINNE